MMKALVYGGPGEMKWRDVPLPDLQDPEDAIVRVDAVTICGTDLHILKGDVPAVERAGSSATRRSAPSWSRRRRSTVRPGDRVLVSCISACGRAATAARAATASASAAAAGSSAT